MEPALRANNVRKITEEIDRLTEQQTHALKSATFIDMTSEQAQEYDSRRGRIAKLAEQLIQIEKSR